MSRPDRRHLARVAAVTALLTCAAASSPAAPAPPVVAAAADELGGEHRELLARTSDEVAPQAVALVTQPAASTTVAELPAVPATLSVKGIPARAVLAYRSAAARLAAPPPASCAVPWVLLAAIGFVESGHGSFDGAAIAADGRALPRVLGPRLDGTGEFALVRDTDAGRLDGDPELDRAVGPMQFIPSTWARSGADGDGNRTRDPHDLDDAALAAGGYLCATSRRLDRQRPRIAAVYSYNHSYDYVRVVLTAAALYAGQSPQEWGVALLPPPVAASPSASPSAGASTSATASAAATGTPSTTAQPAPAPAATAEPSPEPSPEPTAEPSAEPEPSIGPLLPRVG